MLDLFHQDYLKIGMNSSYSPYHTGTIHPILHIVLVKNSYSAVRNWMNSDTQAAAMTFASLCLYPSYMLKSKKLGLKCRTIFYTVVCKWYSAIYLHGGVWLVHVSCQVSDWLCGTVSLLVPPPPTLSLPHSLICSRSIVNPLSVSPFGATSSSL